MLRHHGANRFTPNRAPCRKPIAPTRKHCSLIGTDHVRVFTDTGGADVPSMQDSNIA